MEHLRMRKSHGGNGAADSLGDWMAPRRKTILDRVAERPWSRSPLFWLAVAASIAFFAFFNWALITAFSA